MLDMPHAREKMVDLQVRRRGIRNTDVLDALREVPREAFVPEHLAEFAYEDSPLPIAEGQTISQPFMVALMIQEARIEPQHRVLEIGAGSGYAAAVISRIAAEVYAIERHEALTKAAQERLDRLNYGNIALRTGDGTHGWPEEAPFDAILCAAAAPAVPQPLKDQLEIGGRLVMPVGEETQRLIRVERLSATTFEEKDLGPVTFVPLIGQHAWDESRERRPQETRTFRERSIPELIREAATPLLHVDHSNFAEAFDRFAEAKVVLLGESTHGTSEFYRARAVITRRLIERHGFNIVAVEADWPDARVLDRYVRHQPAKADAEPPFRRFPTWMWRNTDVEAFVEWMRRRNGAERPEARAGFYGLDLYSLGASIQGVLDYLDKVDPEAAAHARLRYACLTPWAHEPQMYGRMALTKGYADCEAAVLKTLSELLTKRLDYDGGDDFLDAEANARLVANAEAYYRAVYYGAAESWNRRDTHMFETLEHLLKARGPNAKAVVWAHNSHIGDASKTEMGIVREELNLGQLCRERFGKDAALIGFGTNTGTVACADNWDEPMQVKEVRPALPESYERLAHEAGIASFLLDLREGQNDEARHRLLAPRLERFIGVIYRPETERMSHYAEASLPQQFDAYVWFDKTTAVTAIPTRVRHTGADETWPFGL